MLKAARAWSTRPTVVMEEWSERDRVLAEALIDYEETAHCPGCGQLKSKAYDKATDGAWELGVAAHCFACAALEEQKKDLEDPDPGDLRVLTLNRTDYEHAKKVLAKRASSTPPPAE